jgi:hypothetical protein
LAASGGAVATENRVMPTESADAVAFGTNPRAKVRKWKRTKKRHR